MLASDIPPALALSFAFVLGATWGSFFNVAIYRWPLGLSVVSPPSHCPACKKPVPAWRNVPILAYLWQRGKAACCGAPMTPRYLVVEVLSGVLAVALAQRFLVHVPAGTTLNEAMLTLATWFVLVGGLIIATFVDLERMEIPDEVSIGGTALGLATMSLRLGDDLPTPLELALGAGAGYLAVMLLLVFAWERWTGRRGMGEGDAKLMLFIGTFLGWKGVLFALVGGSIQGVLAVLASHAAGRPINKAPPVPEDTAGPDTAAPDTGTAVPAPDAAPATATEEEDEDDEDEDPGGTLGRIPFGPFLALAALEFLFFGEQITEAYVDWFLS